MSDLQHYVDSGEVPDDLETLLRLHKEATGEEGEKQVEAEAEESTEADASVAADAEPEAKEEVVEKEPDGILTKDGKHVISYDVLKSERQAAQQFKAKAEQLEREIEALKSGVGNEVSLEAISGMTDDQLTELKEYFPDQYEAIVKQQTALQQATAKLAQVERAEAERQAQVREQIALTVQEEIDNNPVLSHWQQHSPNIWAKCVALDNEIRNDPDTANITMTERFSKIAKAMTQIYGSPIPEQKPVEDVAERPKAAKAQPQAKPPINSLSDLPGGEAVEATERQRIENMSAAEVGDMLMKMSPEKQAEFLSRL